MYPTSVQNFLLDSNRLSVSLILKPPKNNGKYFPILADSPNNKVLSAGFQTLTAYPDNGARRVKLTGKPEVLGQNPVSGSLCPFEITRGLALRFVRIMTRLETTVSHMKVLLVSFRTQ